MFGKYGIHILLGVLVLFLSGAALGQDCQVDSDCPGYNGNEFCDHVRCEPNGLCVDVPSPCSSVCLEEEQRCVDCNDNSDCSTGLCNENTHMCISCRRNSDCPDADWCHGGKSTCERRTGKCVVPQERPCPDSEACVSEFQQCFRCQSDDDCTSSDIRAEGAASDDRAVDFCSAPLKCVKETGRCITGEHPCGPDPQKCDAENERCIECTSDDDCENDKFCALPATCSEEGKCVKGEAIDECTTEGSRAPVEICNEEDQVCDEKMCNTDADCDDGDCSNGQEYCVDYGCVRNKTAECKEEDGEEENGGTRIGTECTEDPTVCTDVGLVCKHSGLSQNRQPTSNAAIINKRCQRCLTDAECIDYDVSTTSKGDSSEAVVSISVDTDAPHKVCNKIKGRCVLRDEDGNGQSDASSLQFYDGASHLADKKTNLSHWFGNFDGVRRNLTNATNTSVLSNISTGMLGGINCTSGACYLIHPPQNQTTMLPFPEWSPVTNSGIILLIIVVSVIVLAILIGLLIHYYCMKSGKTKYV